MPLRQRRRRVRPIGGSREGAIIDFVGTLLSRRRGGDAKSFAKWGRKSHRVTYGIGTFRAESLAARLAHNPHSRHNRLNGTELAIESLQDVIPTATQQTVIPSNNCVAVRGSEPRQQMIPRASRCGAESASWD